MLADATDNVDDNMTEVCIEAIAFLNKAKKESNRIIFQYSVHLGLLGKIRNLNESKSEQVNIPHALSLLENAEHY